MAQEGKGKYFVSWRGRILLVARAQLRLESAEEAAAAEDVQTQARETAENMDQEEDTKAYINRKTSFNRTRKETSL